MKIKFSHYIGLQIMIVLGLGCQGCQSLHQAGPSSEKTTSWKFKKNWIRSTLNQSNYDFKKSNRGVPLIFGKTLIQTNATDGIGAYDIESGQELWKKSIFNGAETGPVFDQQIYLGASDGFFYALNPINGQEVWKYKVGAEVVSEATLDSEHVYFLSALNIIYALKIKTGELAWTYSRPNSSEFSIRGGSKPAVNIKNVYVGFSDGFFVSLDKSTGKPHWEILLNRNKRFKDIDSEITIEDGLLYVSGYDDHLYCLEKDTGSLKWKIAGGSFSGPSFFDNILLYPTSMGEVWGLDKKTNHRLWTYKVPAGNASKIQVFKGSALFGESQGNLVLLNPQTGRVVTSFNPGRGILAAPSLNNTTSEVYFISGEANLYSLTLKASNDSLFDFLSK